MGLMSRASACRFHPGLASWACSPPTGFIGSAVATLRFLIISSLIKWHFISKVDGTVELAQSQQDLSPPPAPLGRTLSGRVACVLPQ